MTENLSTYLCNSHLMNLGRKCWKANIMKLLNMIGLKNFCFNSCNNTYIKRKLISFTDIMKAIYEFQWRNELNRKESRNKKGGNKLRTYYTFKKEFIYENYLDFQTKFSLRKNITKLRISAHKLEIEIGRYKNIPVQNRICKRCNLNKVEDEQHIITSCSKYDQYREMLMNRLSEIFVDFDSLRDQEKFFLIMKCNDYEITTELSKFLSAIVKDRGCF